MTTIEKRSRNTLTDRAGVAAGLRAYADLLDSNPSVPIAVNLTLSMWVHGDDDTTEKQATRQLLRAIGSGHWEKRTYADSLIFEGWLHGVPVDVWVARESVCERVVTGTREVVETVPLGEDTRPMETVTRTEDVVEWICSPLLADAPQAVQS